MRDALAGVAFLMTLICLALLTAPIIGLLAHCWWALFLIGWGAV